MHISLAAEPLFFIGSFPVTNSFLVSIIVSFLLIIFAFIFRQTYKKIPSRGQSAIEAVVEYLLDLTESIAGRGGRRFLPLVLTIFIYILLCNWLGLLPGFGSVGFYEFKEGEKIFVPILRGATADLNTTLALAFVSFFSIQYYGFAAQKLGYFKKFFNFSSPVMLFSGILELISELAKIISFSFRLFGNIFAGEVLLAVIASLIPVLVPFPFYGMEIFVGIIQALVFAMLTLIFINVATVAHGEEVEHGISR